MKHLSEYTQLLSTTAGKTPHLLTHWRHGDIVPFHPHLCSGCRSACREGAGWEVRIMFGDCYVLMVRGTSPPVTRHLCSEARSFSWAEIRQKQDFLWLKTAEGGIDWRFGCHWGVWPSQPASYVMLMSSSIFHVSGQVTGKVTVFTRLLSVLYTGHMSPQWAPSGRSSWTESPFIAAGEEVDERMDRWDEWFQW